MPIALSADLASAAQAAGVVADHHMVFSQAQIGAFNYHPVSNVGHKPEFGGDGVDSELARVAVINLRGLPRDPTFDVSAVRR